METAARPLGIPVHPGRTRSDRPASHAHPVGRSFAGICVQLLHFLHQTHQGPPFHIVQGTINPSTPHFRQFVWHHSLLLSRGLILEIATLLSFSPVYGAVHPGSVLRPFIQIPDRRWIFGSVPGHTPCVFPTVLLTSTFDVSQPFISGHPPHTKRLPTGAISKKTRVPSECSASVHIGPIGKFHPQS